MCDARIINPDDEVLIIEPSFVSYAPLVTLAGGVPVPVATTLEMNLKYNQNKLRQLLQRRQRQFYFVHQITQQVQC